MTANVVVLLLAVLAAKPGVAQTPALEADVEDVVDVLRAAGIADQAALAAALQAAWEAEAEEEFARLRRLGITLSDAEFASAWQNQPGRAAQFAPYGLEEWATDVVRSWAKVQPREAFSWMFAVRSRFAFELPSRSCFERVTTDWARVSPQAGREAEAEALAIRDERLRAEAIVGVVRGNILRGDASRVGGLLEHITDDARRSEIQALYARYIR
jgi:hypothetical protein